MAVPGKPGRAGAEKANRMVLNVSRDSNTWQQAAQATSPLQCAMAIEGELNDTPLLNHFGNTQL